MHHRKSRSRPAGTGSMGTASGGSSSPPAPQRRKRHLHSPSGSKHTSALRTILAAIPAVAGAGLIALGPLVMSSGTASAAPTNWKGAASGTALKLSLAGTQLVGGATNADLATTPSAAAEGSGILLPILTGSQTASATTAGQEVTKPQACATPSSPVPILTLGVACGSAGVSTLTSSLSAQSKGTTANVAVDLSGVLSTVVGPSSPVASALGTILGKLPSIPVAGAPLSTILSGVLGTLSSAEQTVSIDLGSTSSSVTSMNDSITSTATASGGTIDLLKYGSGTALARIVVGAASAQAVETNGTAAPTATASPAIVTVTLAIPGVAPQTVTVGPGKSFTLLAGTPLQSTISVAGGTTSVVGDTASATAQGVKILLAQGLNGGIDLNLAGVTATVDTPVSPSPTTTTTVAAPPVTTPVTTPPSAPIQEVTSIHTGEPWSGDLPYVGGSLLLGSALIGWPRLRRIAAVLLGRARTS